MTSANRWFVLSIFVLSSTINYLDRQTLATVAPVIRGELRLSNEQYGWIVAAFSIAYAFCAPLAGLAIDRIGLNRGISLAVGMWSAAALSTGWVRGFGGLLVCRALLGVAEAAKAWRSAEQAAATPEERERMRRARVDVERQRLDFEDAEKKRVAEENARELRKLKDAEIARLRTLEARVNQGGSTGGKVEPWWNGPQANGKTSGMLQQVDCLGKQARLVIEGEDKKIVKLLAPDPAKVVYRGAGEVALGCGVQKARRIIVEYVPKVNSRLATAGEVATIEFQ